MGGNSVNSVGGNGGAITATDSTAGALMSRGGTGNNMPTMVSAEQSSSTIPG
jgi:hypothetical protein